MSNELPLGWIRPEDRTPEQQQAHARAVASMPRFGIAGAGVRTTSGSSKLDVKLFEAWRHPKVIEDIGFEFRRYQQVTGSCVGAGLGQVLVTLSAVQRLFAQAPTKAAIFFWLFNYGRSRFLYGWKTPGEGSFGSTAAQSVRDEGVIPIHDGIKGLPAFKNGDDEGIIYSEQIEMVYSDGDTREQLELLKLAKEYPVKQVAEITNVDDLAAAVANGYPCTFGCDYYCNSASVRDGYAIGRATNRGGHQWAVLGVKDDPKLGRLFHNQNNWYATIYPKDPAGGPPCSCWFTEEEQARLLRVGECFAFSNFTYFPAQPDIAVPWLI